MQNPFIPNNRANLVVISGQASDEIVDKLIRQGIEVVKTVKVESLLPQIAYHPDLVLHPVDINTLVVAPEVFDYYAQKLNPFALDLIKGESLLGRDYPENIYYNVFRIGKHFAHKGAYTDNRIVESYKKSKISLVNISQGYSKCSTALVDNKSAITSDKKIARELIALGYDILLIESGWIDLPGYDYGFIGGASGHLSRKEMVFTGSLRKHPDKLKIEAFIYNKGLEIIYLSEETIIDLGTIFSFSL